MENLGEKLVEANLLTGDQLEKAKEMQSSLKCGLGEILVKLGFLKEDVYAKFVAESQGLKVVDLDEIVLPDVLVRKIPRNLIEQHKVIPIAFKDGILTIATSDPLDFMAVEEIQLATNFRVEISIATRSALQRAINRLFYSEEPQVETVSKDVEASKEELLKELEEMDMPKKLAQVGESQKVTPMMLRKALIPLLIEKGIITEEELVKKALELESSSEK